MKEKWNENEIDFLIKHYQTNGSKFVANALGRSIFSVKSKAIRVGLITYSPKPWTDDEIIFLKKNYTDNGCKFVCNALGRSKGSVGKKAKTLKLKCHYKPVFTKEELELAVSQSYCFSDLIDRVGKTKTGKYLRIIKQYLILFNIDTSHFDPYKKNREVLNNARREFTLEHWLQMGSTIGSAHLKLILYKKGLKERKCELCGQSEEWQGKRMSLILDHINGIPNDNRIENLRIVCPNCNATLDTHCRGYKKLKKTAKSDVQKNENMVATKSKIIKNVVQTENQIKSHINQRKVKRPEYNQLVDEINQMGYSATGRKYGVSDTAIRKWVKYYEKNK